eukprot:UN33303
MSGQRCIQKEYNYKSSYKGASVMFIEIHDFAKQTQDIETTLVIQYLNQIFLRFDDLTDYYNVFKVETVGEIYMVAAGVPDKCMKQDRKLKKLKPDHARRLADMALDVKMHSNDVLCFNDQLYLAGENSRRTCEIKIGCNSGTIIAGVIGRKLPRYRLMVDTVNVASRMKSTAKVGEIQMTRQFVELLQKEDYRWRERRNVDVKEKGK